MIRLVTRYTRDKSYLIKKYLIKNKNGTYRFEIIEGKRIIIVEVEDPYAASDVRRIFYS